MPPAVALLNYRSSGILWRIFLPNWNFHGVFSTYHYFHREDQQSCDGQGKLYFRVTLSSFRVRRRSDRVQRSSEGAA
jgi:hypothetical protein